MPVIKPATRPADRVLCMLIIPAMPTGTPKTSPRARPVSKLIIITPNKQRVLTQLPRVQSRRIFFNDGSLRLDSLRIQGNIAKSIRPNGS